MSNSRSLVADYAVYLVVRLLVCIIQVLPFRVACMLANRLAWLAYHLDRRHRLVALENLQHAFPGQYSDAQRDRLVRGVYRHFCNLFVEIVHMPRLLNTGNWKNHLAMPNGHLFVERLLSDRPVLVVTGHFGNWEMAGYAMGLLGFTTHAIARRLDNRFLDDFLRRFRERTGQKTLAKHGDFAKMQSLLGQGGVLATLGDQDAGKRGVYVDFFGRPASTHKAIALLALEHSVPMVVIGMPRKNDGRYHVIAADVIFPEEYEGRPNAVREITQRFTAALENVIRQHPEQYFWLHRRWKHQPAKDRRQGAARPKPQCAALSEPYKMTG